MIFASLIFVSCLPYEFHLVTRTVLNLYLYLLYFVFVSCPPGQFHLVTRTVLPKVEKQIALADLHHDHEERDSGWCWWPWCLCWWWDDKKNTSRLVQLPGAINQGGKVQPLCKSGDSRITLMMLKKCKIAHCKNQHDKNIKTFIKNEGPSLSCGEQSIAWGIPTDKQRWSRVENVEDIDIN